MQTLMNKLARLERARTGSGKLVVVRGDERTSDEAMDGLLTEAGVDIADPRTLVVRLKRFMAPDGSFPPPVSAPELVYVMDHR